MVAVSISLTRLTIESHTSNDAVFQKSIIKLSNATTPNPICFITNFVSVSSTANSEYGFKTNVIGRFGNVYRSTTGSV